MIHLFKVDFKSASPNGKVGVGKRTPPKMLPTRNITSHNSNDIYQKRALYGIIRFVDISPI